MRHNRRGALGYERHVKVGWIHRAVREFVEVRGLHVTHAKRATTRAGGWWREVERAGGGRETLGGLARSRSRLPRRVRACSERASSGNFARHRYTARSTCSRNERAREVVFSVCSSTSPPSVCRRARRTSVAVTSCSGGACAHRRVCASRAQSLHETHYNMQLSVQTKCGIGGANVRRDTRTSERA